MERNMQLELEHWVMNTTLAKIFSYALSIEKLITKVDYVRKLVSYPEIKNCKIQHHMLIYFIK